MDRDFLGGASLREGTIKTLREKNPEEVSDRVMVLYSLMRWSVRCCRKRRWRKMEERLKENKKIYIRFIILTSPNHVSNGIHPELYGKDTRVVRRQEMGARRTLRLQPLLVFPQERQAMARK